MKIKIKREGGFIGMTSKANFEFDDLTTDQQNALNALAEKSLKADDKDKEDNKVKEDDAPTAEPSAKTSKSKETDDKTSKSVTRGLGVDDTQPKGMGLELAEQQMPHNVPSNTMRDGFCYSISMKKNGKTVSMTFDDMTAPPEIVEIFQKYVQY